MTGDEPWQVTAAEAWPLLAEDDAVLVDCRTMAEWVYVGLPDLSGLGKEALTIEWLHMGGAPNPAFMPALKARVGTDARVFMLCRSGVRSHAAACAAIAGGYGSVYNISDGFEGVLNDRGRRKSVNGWCCAGLPWKQT